jgi:hypothetical protein
LSLDTGNALLVSSFADSFIDDDDDDKGVEESEDGVVAESTSDCGDVVDKSCCCVKCPRI